MDRPSRRKIQQDKTPLNTTVPSEIGGSAQPALDDGNHYLVRIEFVMSTKQQSCVIITMSGTACRVPPEVQAITYQVTTEMTETNDSYIRWCEE